MAADSLFDSPFTHRMTPSEITGHPFGAVVEGGWKRVAEGLRKRLEASVAAQDDLKATMTVMLTVEQSAALVSHGSTAGTSAASHALPIHAPTPD